jgi:O-antigen/teichoic acid export membrane protein
MAITEQPTSAPDAASALRGTERERKRFIQDNALATGSTMIAGVLGLGLQAMSGHALHPGEFGKAFAVYTFYQLVTRPSATFGRLQAWQTSRELSTAGAGHEDVSGALLRQQTLWLLGVGGLIAIASVLGGSVLAGYMHVSVASIAVAAAAVPFLLAVQPLLGILQGEQRFVPWSMLSILVNLSRIVLIAGLILPLGAFGFLLGNTLAAIVTFVACLIPVWRPMIAGEGRFNWIASLPFIVTGLVSTVAMGVYQGADVVMVEHFFLKVPAGQYAAVASVGSALFFASGGVASAVFPMIAARQATGRSTLAVMGASFALYAAAGLFGTLAFAMFGKTVLVDFAGAAYLPGAKYLALYGLGMALLSWVVLLINTLQSLNSLVLLWVLVPAAILRPVLLVQFHGSLTTVVVVSDLTIGAVAVILSLMYLASEFSRARARRSSAALQVDELSAAEPVGEPMALGLPVTAQVPLHATTEGLAILESSQLRASHGVLGWPEPGAEVT